MTTLSSTYRFADLMLDAARRRVEREGSPIELKALDFDLLRFLVESAPEVVNADVLAETVWGRHFVSPENVAQRVMLLRQNLGDDANRPRYIETVRNKGYRLIPVVERAPAEATGTGPPRRRWLTAVAAVLVLAVALTAATYWLDGTVDRAQPSAGSVAVLPFENLSSDLKDAYFALGMQDEIVRQLTNVSGLKVIPVRPGAGAGASIPEILRGLDVATVLGGSVLYSEGRVRVTPRLTQRATGVSLWSNSYARERSDIFAIQSEIALEVAQALSLELSPAERERIERVPTTDPRARELYLMALARQGRDTREDFLHAIDELEEALDRDENFKEAWVLYAGYRVTAQFFDPGNAGEHRRRGEDAARRALRLDPELGLAHAALGDALWSQRDWTGAETAFRRAISLNMPAPGLGDYAVLQLSVGNFAFARDLLDETRAAEPENPTAHRFLAFSHAALGEWAAANALYESGRRVFTNEDSLAPRRMRKDRMYWLIGRNELAEARAIEMPDPLDAAMLASLDTRDEALAELRRAYADTVPGNPSLRRDIGVWAGHFGDPELALDAMRAAIDEQGGIAVFLWYPQLAPLRRLPEFKAYMRDIGMVAYWQEYGWPPLCRPLDAHDFECD